MWKSNVCKSGRFLDRFGQTEGEAMKFQYAWVLAVATLLCFGACGTKKKISHQRGSTYSNKSGPLSDASDARSNAYGGHKLEDYAKLLGVSPGKLENNVLYEMIDEWMGAPHRYGGMTKRGGDCSGFVTLLYDKVYRRELPRRSRDMADQVKRKYRKQLKEGELVFFSFGGHQLDHVGIYLHNDNCVHVSTRKGVIISSLNDAWYGKYLKRCGTPRG